MAGIPTRGGTVTNLQFIIIGDGPEKKKLQLLITNYQLQNIHFLGYQENASQYLKAFDLFVLPSRKEGLPYTILEAIHAEIPIIATDVGGVSELIEHKKTGLLVKSDSSTGLSKQIVFALTHTAKMNTYASEGTTQRSHSLHAMVVNTRGLYNRKA